MVLLSNFTAWAQIDTFSNKALHPFLIFDRFGNQYSPQQASRHAQAIAGGGTSTCIGGNFDFELDYSDVINNNSIGFDDPIHGQTRQDILCQVLTDLSYLIQPGISPCQNRLTLKIKVEPSIYSDTNVLGIGSSYYITVGNVPDINYGNTWYAINTGSSEILPTQYFPWALYHGQLTFNFFTNINWHYNLNTNPVVGEHDLYEVMLHECMHMLGFASLISANGQSKFADALTVYTKYDDYLKNSMNNAALLLIDTCYETAFNYDTITTLTPGNCSLIFDGTYTLNNQLPVYAPVNWSNGSSLSHLDTCGAGYPYYVMAFASYNQDTIAIRRPSPEETHILCDIGYQTTGNYGNGSYPFHTTNNPNYTCGSVFAAAHDYQSNCSTFYKTTTCDTSSITLSFSNLNANDQQTDPALIANCLHLFSNGTITNINAAGFTYHANTPGIHFLSYIAENAMGQQNKVYIFINVFSCPGLNCTNTSNCNYICNPALTYQKCNSSNTGENPWQDFVFSSLNQDSCKNFPGWGGFYTRAKLKYTHEKLENPEQDGEILFAGGSNGSDSIPRGCGMYTEVNLPANKKYIHTYLRKRVHANYLEGLNYIDRTIDTLSWRLTNYADIDFPFQADWYIWVANQPNNFAEVAQEANLDPGDWEKVVSTFTTNQDWELLYVYTRARGILGTPTMDMITFDHVDLIEDRFIDNDTIYVNTCGQPLNLGDPTLCSIPDMVYEWTDMNTGDTISNNPYLSINAINNNTYRLVRRMVQNPLYAVTGMVDSVYREAYITVVVNDAPGCCQLLNSANYDALNNYTLPETATWTSSSNGIANGKGVDAANPLRIKQKLTVPTGKTLTINNMYLEFGLNGEIIVEKGAKLILDNTILTGDPICQTMWHGVQVHGPGANTLQTTANTGFVVLKNKTTIAFALTGILAGSALFNNTTGATTMQGNSYGGVVNSQNARFYNCANSVLMLAHYVAPPNAIFFSKFIANKFLSDAQMRAPFIGQKTIIHIGAALTAIFSCQNNTFENAQFGVNTVELGFGSQNLYNNTFTNCGFGIKTEQMGGILSAGYAYFIRENTLNNCANAITCLHDNTLIYKNSINAPPFTPLFNNSNGIFVGSAANTQVLQNTIYNQKTGMALINNPSLYNLVRCNTTNNTDAALYLSQNNVTTDITFNSFSNYSNAGIFVNNPNSQLNEQGKCSNDPPELLPAGNLFNNLGNLIPDIYSDIAFTYWHHPGTPGSDPWIPDITDGLVDVQVCVQAPQYSYNCTFNAFAPPTMQELENCVKNNTNINQRNQCMAALLSLPTNKNRIATALPLLQSLNTQTARQVAIPMLLQDKQYTKLQQQLNLLPTTTAEELNFKNYYTLLKNVCQNNRTIYELTNQEKTDLIAIADQYTATSYKAQATLYAAYNIRYTLPAINLDKTDKTATNSTLSTGLQIVPNPVSNSSTIYYTIEQEELNNAQLQIYAIDGSLKASYNLTQTQGNIAVQGTQFNNGMYICLLKVNGYVKDRAKMVVIHHPK